jgi:hypothetical protein
VPTGWKHWLPVALLVLTQLVAAGKLKPMVYRAIKRAWRNDYVSVSFKVCFYGEKVAQAYLAAAQAEDAAVLSGLPVHWHKLAVLLPPARH